MKEQIWVPTIIHSSGDSFWEKLAKQRQELVPKEGATLFEAQVNEAVIRKIIARFPVVEPSPPNEKKKVGENPARGKHNVRNKSLFNSCEATYISKERLREGKEREEC